MHQYNNVQYLQLAMTHLKLSCLAMPIMGNIRPRMSLRKGTTPKAVDERNQLLVDYHLDIDRFLDDSLYKLTIRWPAEWAVYQSVEH